MSTTPEPDLTATVIPGNYPKATRLAESFPTLVGVPGVRPFDVKVLQRSMRSLSAGARHAAAFVLAVHNSLHSNDFNAVQALGTWDETHRAAFQAWAARPYWW